MRHTFRTMLLALLALAFIRPVLHRLALLWHSGRLRCRFMTNRFAPATAFYGPQGIGPTIRMTATTGYPALGWKHPRLDTSGLPDGGDGRTAASFSMKVTGAPRWASMEASPTALATLATAFEGGRWDHGHFFYNRAVMHIDETRIHNVYNTTVIHETVINRVSYNGGQGGIDRRPSAHEQAD
jgi:hypothetical protein